MIFQLAKVLLLPVLVVQGLQVKRGIQKLPEAGGDRSGVFGTGVKIKLLIIGDSAAAGVGARTQQQALSGRLVAALGSACEVAWKLRARSGHASGQVLTRLQTAAAENFDFVVVSVGVNDVTAQTGVKEWLANLKNIIALLKLKFSARHIILSGLPPMHLFPGLPQPLRWWLGLRAKMLNDLMQETASNDSECTFLAIAFPVDQSFMAEDGIHPGEPAYAFWGEEVAKVLRTKLGLISG